MQSAAPQIVVSAPAQPFHNTLAGKTLLTIAASGFVALCAHIAVPLPFTPVPLTMVNLGVLLVGLTLGPVAGFSAMVLYLLEGASGLPVFATNGPGSILYFIGPTGGFLLAYPFVAAIAGALSIPKTGGTRATRFASAALASTVATIFLFVIGAAWLQHFYHSSAAATLHMAVVPFLPGEIVKIAAAAGIYSAGRLATRS